MPLVVKLVNSEPARITHAGESITLRREPGGFAVAGPMTFLLDGTSVVGVRRVPMPRGRTLTVRHGGARLTIARRPEGRTHYYAIDAGPAWRVDSRPSRADARRASTKGGE